MSISLTLLPTPFAVCRFDPHTPVLPLIPPAGFFALTRTADELSLVIAETAVQSTWQAEYGWRALKVIGPLDFSLVGILSSLAEPLAAQGISIFAISTYDTDYVLLKAGQLPAALHALQNAGFVIAGK